MRQMPQLLPATALQAKAYHGRPYAGNYGADRHDEARDDLALGGPCVIQGLPPRKEGEAVVPVSQVLDIREAGDEGIGHGDWFRVNGIRKHSDLPPHRWVVASICCVPTTQSMTAISRGAIHKSDCNKKVTGHGFRPVNAYRKLYGTGVAA